MLCAGSDQVHPIGAFVIGGVAGFIFVKGFTWEQEKLKLDDVLGVWPLHGICGTWGGIACGIFGQKALGGLGEVSLLAQVVGSLLAVVYVWRIVETAYFKPALAGTETIKEAPLSFLIPVWILILANIYFGIDTRLSVQVAQAASQSLFGVSP